MKMLIMMMMMMIMIVIMIMIMMLVSKPAAIFQQNCIQIANPLTFFIQVAWNVIANCKLQKVNNKLQFGNNIKSKFTVSFGSNY